ncbi:MAG: hypothetical protein U9R19_08505 [Bacteroidota bacterium]|nr:hypothetical protein [Bacteroidota bacterium]
MDIEQENIFDKIKDVFGSMSGNVNVLEQQIDIELQMEYFKTSKKYRKFEPEDILKRKDELFSDEIPVDEKRKLLVQLASIDDVEAFRAIEKYNKLPDKDLQNWSVMALQESRMIIESSLLDENQVFISTGLGGKGSKLRYFVVLIHQKKENFSKIQQKLVSSELDYSLSKYNGELESIVFSDHYAKLLTVVPISAPLQKLFQDAIHEANQIGDFIMENFIVTNVKQLSDTEITDFLTKPPENIDNIEDMDEEEEE